MSNSDMKMILTTVTYSLSMDMFQGSRIRIKFSILPALTIIVGKRSPKKAEDTDVKAVSRATTNARPLT